MFGTKKISGDDRRAAVVGLGRFGMAVARSLTERGVEVLAVDAEAKSVQEIGEEITHAVVADSTDIEALRQIGLQDYTHAVVAIGSDIEASILTTTLLSELGIPDIWAKAVTATHGRILARVGADHVVFPEAEMGKRVGAMVTGAMLDYLQVDDDLAIVKTYPPERLMRGPIDVATFEAERHVRIVAMKRGSRGYESPGTSLQLRAGDVLVLSGAPSVLRELTTRGN